MVMELVIELGNCRVGGSQKLMEMGILLDRSQKSFWMWKSEVDGNGWFT